MADTFDAKWLEAEAEAMHRALALLEPFQRNTFALLHEPIVTQEMPLPAESTAGNPKRDDLPKRR
ncbi:MAG TPA: hypothetical protein VGZ47_13235 [Gemmataceae bacterium]|nr:hypothetical protein [Gemmataceae bacterium]